MGTIPPGFVQLNVTGNRSIIAAPFKALAQLSVTWAQFLEANGVKLSPQLQDKVQVGTGEMRNKGNGVVWGWTADVNDLVQDFMKKYERKRPIYRVRITFKRPGPAFRASNHSAPEQQNGIMESSTNVLTVGHGRGKRNGSKSKPKRAKVASIVMGANVSTGRNGPRASTSAGIYMKPRYTPGFAGSSLSIQNKRARYGTRLRSVIQQDSISTGNESGRSQNQTTSSRTVRGYKVRTGTGVLRIANVQSIVKIEQPQIMDLEERGEEETEEVGFSSQSSSNGNNAEVGHHDGNPSAMEGGDDDDSMSMCTALTQEEQELRRDGIQVNDLKSHAERKFTRFSNGFFLKVRNEIRKLKRNNSWDMNVKRSPLASYFLQELFKE